MQIGRLLVPLNAAKQIDTVAVKALQPGKLGEISGQILFFHRPIVFVRQRGMGRKAKAFVLHFKGGKHRLLHGAFAVAKFGVGVYAGQILFTHFFFLPYFQ